METIFIERHDRLKNKVVYGPRKEANIIKDFFPHPIYLEFSATWRDKEKKLDQLIPKEKNKQN